MRDGAALPGSTRFAARIVQQGITQARASSSRAMAGCLFGLPDYLAAFRCRHGLSTLRQREIGRLLNAGRYGNLCPPLADERS